MDYNTELYNLLLKGKKIYRDTIDNNLRGLYDNYFEKYGRREAEVCLFAKEVLNYSGYIYDLDIPLRGDFIILEPHSSYFINKIPIYPISIYKEICDNTPLPYELCNIVDEYCYIYKPFTCWKQAYWQFSFFPQIKNFSGVVYLGLTNDRSKVDKFVSENFYKIYRKYYMTLEQYLEEHKNEN